MRGREGMVGPAGWGLVIDLHGQSHDKQRIQVGYVVKGPTLRQTNEQLNNDHNNGINSSSIRTLAQHWQSVGLPLAAVSSSSPSIAAATTPVTFTDVIRGPQSLGALFESAGYGAVPSNRHQDAGDKLYFNGIYPYHTIPYIVVRNIMYFSVCMCI
jgi:hypothetical protein